MLEKARCKVVAKGSIQGIMPFVIRKTIWQMHQWQPDLTWRPFMLYPQGSKTNSSMSELGSRSEMPLLTVVCCADTKSAPLQNCAACIDTRGHQYQYQRLFR